MDLDTGPLDQVRSSADEAGYKPPDSLIKELEEKSVKPHIHGKNKKDILKNICNLLRNTGLDAPDINKQKS